MTKLTFDVDFNKDPEEILKEIQERAKAEVAKRESKIKYAAFLSKLHQKVNDEIGTDFKSINDLIRALTQFANPKLKEKVSSSSSGRRVTVSMTHELFDEIKKKLSLPNPNKAAIARETGASVVQVRKVASGGYDQKFASAPPTSSPDVVKIETPLSEAKPVDDPKPASLDSSNKDSDLPTVPEIKQPTDLPEPSAEKAPDAPLIAHPSMDEQVADEPPLIIAPPPAPTLDLPPVPASPEPAPADPLPEPPAPAEAAPELPPIAPPSMGEEIADEPPPLAPPPAPTLDLPPVPAAPEPASADPLPEPPVPAEAAPELPPIAPPSMGEEIADEPPPLSTPPAPSLDLPDQPPSAPDASPMDESSPPPAPPSTGAPKKPTLSLKPKGKKPGLGGKPGKPTLSLKTGKKKPGGLKITRPPMKPPSS